MSSVDDFWEKHICLKVPLEPKGEEGWTLAKINEATRYPLTPAEFDFMWDSDLLIELCVKYEGIFSVYESDMVDWDLEWLLERAERDADHLPALCQAARQACELGTGVYFML